MATVMDPEVDFASAWSAAITAALGELVEHELRTHGDDGCFFLSQINNGDQSLSRSWVACRCTSSRTVDY